MPTEPTPDAPEAETQAAAVSHPLAYLVGVAVLVVAADLLLALALSNQTRQPDIQLTGAHDLRDQLVRATSDRAPTWLLIGDSVLAGDVMASTVPNWHEQRVLDHLRREQSPIDPHRFYQVGLDGLLPNDALAIVTLLDALDPEGSVAVALELNLRYFSPHYAKLDVCSRDWICDAARLDSVFTAPETGVFAWASRALDWLEAHAPIARHRRLLDDHWEPSVPEVSSAKAPPIKSDPLEAKARLLAHYRGDPGDPAHTQRRALELLLTRLTTRQRRALIFQTPLADGFAESLEVAAQQHYGTLAATVHDHAERGAPIRFANLDAELFGDSHFLDHCHLTPEGNRLLALNLLHEMNVGLTRVPGPQELATPETSDQTLLAHMPWNLPTKSVRKPTAIELTKHRWRYPRADPGSLAARPGGNDIVLADASRHTLFRLRGAMQTLEPFAGQLDISGGEDGPIDQATFETPSAPVYLGNDVYVLDDSGHRIRRIHERQVSTLSLPRRWQRAQMVRLATDGQFLYALNSSRVLRIDPKTGQTELWLAAKDIARAQKSSPRKGTELAQPTGTDTTPPLESKQPLKPKQTGSSKASDTPPSKPKPSTPGPLPSTTAPSPPHSPKRNTRAGPRVRLRALTVSPEGDVYVADQSGQIWLRPQTGSLKQIFENTANEPIPEVYGAHYPFGFDEIGLDKIVDLAFVPRYGGLLVQEQRATPVRVQGLTEMVHLHFFHLKSRQVYPWLKPLPYGDAYTPMNHRAKARVSWLHRGALAFDPVTATTFIGEYDRPRMFRFGDGLYGAARIGNLIFKHQKPLGHLGSMTGQRISETFHPEQFVDQRITHIPRKGPYFGLLLGSSMTAVSDLVGQYSLGRRLEQELSKRLALRDQLGFELYQRTFGAPSLDSLVSEAERFVSATAPVDVLVIEIQNVTDKYFGKVNERNDSEEIAWLRTQFERLTVLQQRFGTHVVLIQNEGIGRRNRDGLRQATPQILRLVALAKQYGFTVVDPTARLLVEHLEASPWGNPPFKSGRHHASVWAIDKTAEVLASMIYPRLRKHLRDSDVPARQRKHAGAAPRPVNPLGAELQAWKTELKELPKLAPGKVQHAFDTSSRTLTVFVDLGSQTEATQYPALAARALAIALVDRGFDALATRISLRLAQFRNYDEYGQGVLSGASVVFERDLTTAADVRRLLESAVVTSPR